MAKTYQFAIVESAGMHGQGLMAPVRCGDNLKTLRTIAKRMTTRHREAMAAHGGSSGSYRVIPWNASRDHKMYGHDVDRRPSA